MKRLTALSILFIFVAMPAFAGYLGYNGSTTLGVVQGMKCSTGLSCSKVGANMVVTVAQPTFTLASGETIVNSTDDTVGILSDDNDIILNVIGFEAKTATLALWADQGDDATDKFSLTATTTGTLQLKNDTTTLLTFSSAGAMTLADSETFTNASDAITFAFDDAAATVKVAAFEATNSNLILQADESDDNGDDWQLASVASGNTFTISNDTSGSQVAKFTMAASDGDITLTGGITGDGGDTVSGFLQAQVASTTTSITAAQCGSTFVSNSADVMDLPEASTVLGCRITFIAGTADDFDINPADGTDQIMPITASGGTITPSAGDAIRLTDKGASVTLEAIDADSWAAVAHNGAITDVN